MGAIPQIITASIALLVAFLIGCIIGWFLRAKIFKSGQQDMAEIKPSSTDLDSNVPISRDVSDKTVAAKVTKNPEIDNRPAVIAAPRDGKKDDLKQIKGIGPKLEATLNGLGIYHFDQIAAWSKQEIEWVDDYLSFKGRIERDGWISQAKKLADI